MLKIFLKENSFRLYVFITLVVIEFLATTTIHIEGIDSIWDKAKHFSAFFVLYILFSFAFKKLSIKSKFFILLAFGLQIEIVQSFIDGRCFSLLDVLADTIGIVLSIGALFLIKKKSE